MAKKKKKWDVHNESPLATFKKIPGLTRFEIARNGVVRSVKDKTYICATNTRDGWCVRLWDSEGNKGTYSRHELLRHTYG